MGAALEKSQGVDRGMFGVFRPIYTVGAALSTKSFLYNAIVMTIVEYYGSCIFDKDKKLWDYSLVPGNFEGRISLTSSVAFALFGKTFNYLNDETILVITCFCLIYLAAPRAAK
jgi:uncharacterized membrane protein